MAGTYEEFFNMLGGLQPDPYTFGSNAQDSEGDIKENVPCLSAHNTRSAQIVSSKLPAAASLICSHQHGASIIITPPGNLSKVHSNAPIVNTAPTQPFSTTLRAEAGFLTADCPPTQLDNDIFTQILKDMHDARGMLGSKLPDNTTGYSSMADEFNQLTMQARTASNVWDSALPGSGNNTHLQVYSNDINLPFINLLSNLQASKEGINTSPTHQHLVHKSQPPAPGLPMQSTISKARPTADTVTAEALIMDEQAVLDEVDVLDESATLTSSSKPHFTTRIRVAWADADTSQHQSDACNAASWVCVEGVQGHGAPDRHTVGLGNNNHGLEDGGAADRHAVDVGTNTHALEDGGAPAPHAVDPADEASKGADMSVIGKARNSAIAACETPAVQIGNGSCNNNTSCYMSNMQTCVTSARSMQHCCDSLTQAGESPMCNVNDVSHHIHNCDGSDPSSNPDTTLATQDVPGVSSTMATTVHANSTAAQDVPDSTSAMATPVHPNSTAAQDMSNVCSVAASAVHPIATTVATIMIAAGAYQTGEGADRSLSPKQGAEEDDCLVSQQWCASQHTAGTSDHALKSSSQQPHTSIHQPCNWIDEMPHSGIDQPPTCTDDHSHSGIDQPDTCTDDHSHSGIDQPHTCTDDHSHSGIDQPHTCTDDHPYSGIDQPHTCTDDHPHSDIDQPHTCSNHEHDGRHDAVQHEGMHHPAAVREVGKGAQRTGGEGTGTSLQASITQAAAAEDLQRLQLLGNQLTGYNRNEAGITEEGDGHHVPAASTLITGTAGGSFDDIGGDGGNTMGGTCSSGPENATEYDEVEPFSLDPDFDYDNVKCTPRPFPWNRRGPFPASS